MRVYVVPAKPVDSIMYVEACEWYKHTPVLDEDIVQQRRTGARVVMDTFEDGDVTKPVLAEVYMTTGQIRELQKKLTQVQLYLETKGYMT